jgi:hypothetical protein
MYFDYDEPPVDDRVRAYAVEHGINMYVLDWHLEAHHGLERHNEDYEEAIPHAATCVRANECDGDPIDIHLPKYVKDKL